MMHESLGAFGIDGVDNLGIRERAKGCGGDDLSLTTGEHGGTMGSWEKVDLGVERTDLVDFTSVWTDLVFNDKTSDFGGFHLFEDVGDHHHLGVVVFGLWFDGVIFIEDLFLKSGDGILSLELIKDRDGFDEFLADLFLNVGFD